ncbi:MAG: DUF1223 domain-containing protein, partial [Verrucomicrobia bacterium]|nr:DUF1223 domain-containing protein [Verrucomicrobiota bacterium]
MRRSYATLLIIGSFLFSTFTKTRGQESITFQSPETRVQVLELFTSQGCSSCPPAERWLNQFADYPGLWTEIIPVAFHLDYWDRLGWKDPFANKQNTARQYQYSKNGDIRNVYLIVSKNLDVMKNKAQFASKRGSVVCWCRCTRNYVTKRVAGWNAV